MMQFKLDEKLLRGVRDWPKYWKKDGSVSPVAFKTRKTETGTSVFRQDTRTVAQSVQCASEKLEGAIISVTYEQCTDLDICVVETNATTYHCELTNKVLQRGITALTNYQCQELASVAVIEKI